MWLKTSLSMKKFIDFCYMIFLVPVKFVGMKMLITCCFKWHKMFCCDDIGRNKVIELLERLYSTYNFQPRSL